MGLAYEYLTFNGKSSRDFKVWISGSGIFDAPERDTENIEIPGRTGDLHIDKGRYKNMPITYPAFITEQWQRNFDGFKAYMLSQIGPQVLEDSYDPDHFRRAVYKSAIQPKMAPRNVAGEFNITFDCDPRRFLKSGQKSFSIESNVEIQNPTLFTALPLIRAYGTGQLVLNSVSVIVQTANVYTDIDCETQEAYKGSTNCNGNIVLSDDDFPVLNPGFNYISYNGFSAIEITPRWWTI